MRMLVAATLGAASALLFGNVAANQHGRVVEVEITSKPQRGDTYGAGEAIDVRVRFDRPVTITGAPSLTMEIGVQRRPMRTFGCGDPCRELWFTYVVREADLDEDGIALRVGGLVADAATIRDLDGYDIDLDLRGVAFDHDPAHAVDGAVDHRAVVTSVYVSPPRAEGVFGAGETIEVRVEFDEPVSITGVPVLALQIGDRVGTATGAEHQTDVCDAGGDCSPLYFSYVVEAGDVDLDGIGIAADAMSTPDGAMVDRRGNDAVLDLGEHAFDESEHKVDGRLERFPAVRRIAFGWPEPQRGDTYGLGEVITVFVMFGERVVVTGTPELQLLVGTEQRTAYLGQRFRQDCGAGRWRDEFVQRSCSGLGFDYIVQASDHDMDGLQVVPSSLRARDGAIRALDGRPAELGFDDMDLGGAAREGVRRVDGSIDRAPRVYLVAFYESPQRGDTYGVGETITVEVAFDEPIFVAGLATLALDVGGRTRHAKPECDDHACMFSYVVRPDDRDADGVGFAADAIKLNGSEIVDLDGNPAELDLGALAIAQDRDRKVDGRRDSRPAVDSIWFATEPISAATYGAGETIGVSVQFDEEVETVGEPELLVELGTSIRRMRFAEEHPWGVRFEYVVREEDRDADGIRLAAGGLQLGGGSIRDSAGNDAEIDTAPFALFQAHGHRIDGGKASLPVAPIAVGAAYRGEPYLIGQTLAVTVLFTRDVAVSGRPQLVLEIAGQRRSADFARVAGREVLFEYRFSEMDRNLQGGWRVAADALAPNGGSITDAATGASAELSLAGALPDYLWGFVDTLAGAPTGVVILSRPARTDGYRPGETVRVAVRFAGESGLEVEASPTLVLIVGQRRRAATFVRAIGHALHFAYEVQAADSDDDGIGVPRYALQGGVVRDAAGNLFGEVDLGRHAIAAAPGHRVAGS